MSAAALEACAMAVRRADPDRYFSALFAPARVRPALFALYALNHELARIGETVREPMMGHIRLQWWREAIEGSRRGQPRRHDVAEALSVVFAAHPLPDDLVEAMLVGREFDASTDAFANFDQLVAYLDATSGNLMRLAAWVLAPDRRDDALARSMGVAYGLAGVLRSFRHHSARGKLYVPTMLLEEIGIPPAAAISTRHEEALAGVRTMIASRAETYYRTGRSLRVDRSVAAAYLPSALVPLYLNRAKRQGISANQDIPILRRQISLLAAALRGFP